MVLQLIGSFCMQMEPKPSTDGVYPLFSRLCESVLAQTYAKGGSRGDHLHMNFESPKYDILRRGLDHRMVVQHLVRTTFDLILLQKWVWFGTWQTDMSPECRCLAHTYEMNLKGRHEEAARLECTVSSLMDSGLGHWDVYALTAELVFLTDRWTDRNNCLTACAYVRGVITASVCVSPRAERTEGGGGVCVTRPRQIFKC